MEKTCRVCKIEKDTSAFAKDRSRTDGLQRMCRSCDNDRFARNGLNYTPKRAEILKKYSREYLKNPENQQKIEARKQMVRALKNGSLVRADSCELCGSDKNMEGHHPDYSQPLLIQWLCKKCHWREDQKLLTK